MRREKTERRIRAAIFYQDDFLYDLKADPFELNNLAGDARYAVVREDLAARLKKAMVQAGEMEPVILEAGEKIKS